MKSEKFDRSIAITSTSNKCYFSKPLRNGASERSLLGFQPSLFSFKPRFYGDQPMRKNFHGTVSSRHRTKKYLRASTQYSFLSIWIYPWDRSKTVSKSTYSSILGNNKCPHVPHLAKFQEEASKNTYTLFIPFYLSLFVKPRPHHDRPIPRY